MDAMTRDRARAAAIVADDLKAWGVTARAVRDALPRAFGLALHGGPAQAWPTDDQAAACGGYALRRVSVELGLPLDGAGAPVLELVEFALRAA